MSDNWLHFFPADVQRPKPDWPSLRDGLIARGFILPASGADATTHAPGPLFDAYCDVPRSRYRWREPEIEFEDRGDSIGVVAGSNMLQPPGIPGTDRVVEDWADFIGRWTDDPNERWIDAETGRAYGLLDLDWENTFGAGRCFFTVLTPGYLRGDKTAALLHELTGQEFRFALVHL